MESNLIPVYRERELYTLFYDQQQNVIYKFQHRNKSFGLFFMFIIAMTWFSESLDPFYINYKNTFLFFFIFLFFFFFFFYIFFIFIIIINYFFIFFFFLFFILY